MPPQQSCSTSGRYRLASLALSLLLCACGGGGGGGESAAPPDLGASTPITTPPDTTAPTVTASVDVTSETVTFIATTSDNVGVTEVVFMMDGGALEGTISKTPNEGVFSLPISNNFIADGTHSVVARARDAAGNTADSSAVGFEVRRGTPPEPPTVTTSVAGNFGLIRFSAVTNIVNTQRLEFLLDGNPVGVFRGVDSGVRFLAFDARGLADGRHSVVARVRHRGANGQDENVDSAPVSFDVNASAGIAEAEPNDEPASATPVAGDVQQIFGQTEVGEPPPGSSFAVPRSDYYRLSLPAQTRLRVDMRTNGYQFLSMSLQDAQGEILVRQTSFGAVNSLDFTSGDSPQDVYIHVSSGPVQLEDDQSKYLLLLSYP
jgi:hypothetical protein